MRRSKFRRPCKVLIFNGARVLVAIVRSLHCAAELTHETPPQPLKGERGVARGESRFLLQAKPPLSQGGLEGLSIWSRTLLRNAQKKDSYLLSFVRHSETESRIIL